MQRCRPFCGRMARLTASPCHPARQQHPAKPHGGGRHEPVAERAFQVAAGVHADLPAVQRLGDELEGPMQLAVPTSTDQPPSLEYDAERSEEYFQDRQLEVAARIAQLGGYLLRFLGALAGSKLDAALLGQTEAAANRPALALQRLLTDAGPSFVKVAQTLAMRVDVIGERYAAALAELQDNVRPFDTKAAMAIVERELGAPVGEVFSSIEGPIASASLGQVYRATLAGSGDCQVAVKVQRPGAETTIAMDVYLLRGCVGRLQRVARLRRDLRPLADEIGRALLQECDFRIEAANTAAFAAAHRSLPLITVPHILAGTRHVLVSEWVVGHSPNQLLAMSRAGDVEARRQLLVMVREGIRCSITQLLVTGVLHGDPHSGNLLMEVDGRLCYLDHGLLVRITDQHRAAMMSALIHLGLGQWNKLVRVDDLGNLDLLREDTDRAELALDLQREFNEVLLQGSSSGSSSSAAGDGGAPACDLDAQLPLLQLQTSSLSFRSLTGVLFRVAFRYKFLLPSYFPLIVRAMSSLEGLALSVDPSFKLVSAGMPVVLNHMLSDQRPASQALLRELLLTESGALRVDATSEQILQVWLSAARQAASTTQADPSSTSDMAVLLLDRRHVPLRRVLMAGNPALTILGITPRFRHQLRGLLVDALSNRQAMGALQDRSSVGRARRRRLAMMCKASVPVVLRSPPQAVLALLAFTLSVGLGIARRWVENAWHGLCTAAAALLGSGKSSGGSSGRRSSSPGTQPELPSVQAVLGAPAPA